MMPTSTDEKLAEAIHDLSGALTAFRIEVERRFAAMETAMERRFGALEKQIDANAAESRVEFRWIKGIGAALLLAAFSFAGWTIAETTALKADVRHQGVVVNALEARVKSVEGRLDKIDSKLDAVLARLPK